VVNTWKRIKTSDKHMVNEWNRMEKRKTSHLPCHWLKILTNLVLWKKPYLF